jgi:hypothetical protein
MYSYITKDRDNDLTHSVPSIPSHHLQRNVSDVEEDQRPTHNVVVLLLPVFIIYDSLLHLPRTIVKQSITAYIL